MAECVLYALSGQEILFVQRFSGVTFQAPLISRRCVLLISRDFATLLTLVYDNSNDFTDNH